MNPLLGRLYQNRSKSKTKHVNLSHDEQRRNGSLDRALIPKIGVKAKLEALPEMQTQKRISSLVRANIGKLPSLNTNPVMEIKERTQIHSRNQFRNRKLSTSIRQMQANFFATELEEQRITDFNEPEVKMFRPDSIIKREEKRQAQPQVNEEEELFEYLKILETNEDLNEEFCYMNRRSKPYSYFIVDYEERNRQQYLTVSLRGITSYKEEQENEFFTIKKLSKEIRLYKQIKQIPYFKDYLIVKVMWHWKAIMIRRKFNLKCKFITAHLFSQNPILQEYIKFLHSLAVDYSGGNFFNFPAATLRQSLEGFSKMAIEGADKNVNSAKLFDDLVEKNLRSTLETLLSKFRIEERVTLGSADRKRQDEPYLPFDSKRRSMKYTQMAKLKQFQWMMYKVIKYTDQVRFNVKLNMVQKCYENSIADLRHLKKASQHKDTVRFTNWVEMNFAIEGEPGKATLKTTPTVEQLSECFLEIKQHCLSELFKQHFLLIDNRQELYCESIDFASEDKQKPSRFDLKYYIVKQPQFIALEAQFKQALNDIMDKVKNMITKVEEILLSIYNKNSNTNDFSTYLSNSALNNYLFTYREDIERVVAFDEVAEYALAMLMMSDIREQARKAAEQKFKAISSAIPSQILRRSSWLQGSIRGVYNKFKENPYSVQDYISFSLNYKKQKEEIVRLEQEMQQLLNYQQLVYKYGIKIGETAKLSISDVQSYLKELMKRFEQIQENQEKQRKKFQGAVQEMIPMLEDKSSSLYQDVKDNSIVNNQNSELKVAQQTVKAFMDGYYKLEMKKREIFQYQRKLGLGHRELEEYSRMEATVLCIDQVWKARAYYLKVYEFTSTQGYGTINELDVNPLNLFLSNSDRYTAHLECFDLLHEFKQATIVILKIIKLSQLFSYKTLTQEHIEKIKVLLKPSHGSHIKTDLIFSSESKHSITAQMLSKETNIGEVQEQISEIVFQSQQENMVKSQLNEVEEFWKKNKVKLISEDLAQNELLILHLDPNQELHEKLGYFLVMLKNIEGSPHVAGLAHDRAVINRKTCSYLRQVLWAWQSVEKQWKILLPVMANYSAVKHQSNIFFEFTSVDTLIKKFIRQVSEMVSLRRLCEDHNDKRYLNTLEEYQRQLASISKIFMNFLDSKRITYGRFCFMSDQELIQMLEHVKDARSASRFISSCFFSQNIRLDGELMAAFEHPNELFKTRKVILKGEPDQIFKTVQENMRYSIKFMVKNMLPKLKISTPPQVISKEFITQVILICDKIFWTEMSELYLTTNTYDAYKLLLRKSQQNIANLFNNVSKKKWMQTAIRLNQMMHLREIGLELIRDQITTSDFKWKEQIRMYSTEEDIFVAHFDGKMPYSCEYRPPTHISIPTNTSTRFLYESYRACQMGNSLVVGGLEGEGKRNLASEASSMMGTYSREVICNNKHSIQFLLKIVQGVLSAGAWVSFYEFDNLSYSVCAQLLANLYTKTISTEYKTNCSLFMLIYHGSSVEQISPYSFINFSVIEPDRERICVWMLKLNGFKKPQDLTLRILKFLKIVKPFLNRAFGSELRLVRQVIINSGTKKRDLNQSDEETELKLIAQALRDQVIYKEQESKADCLNRALYAHFGVTVDSSIENGIFQQKVKIISNMLTSGVQNIIVLGERSCKSSVIRESISKAGLEPLWLYPQAKKVFFDPEVIDFMRTLTPKNVVVYDGNQMMVEWADLVTAGHLFIEGRRASLSCQVMMELRSIDQCSPSFVSKCQIVYLGSSVITRFDKLLKLMPETQQNHLSLKEALTDLFGKNFQGAQEDIFLKLIAFVSGITVSINAKNMFRLLVWIQAMLKGDYIWVKQYGGSCFDFMLTGSYELVPADPVYYHEIPYPYYKYYLLVPTKKNSVVMSAVCQMLNAKAAVHLMGSPQSGKTSLMHFLKSKILLSSTNSADNWSEVLKKKLTYVRRERHNWLIDLQKEGMKFVVDDLDLGEEHHLEYARELIETSSFRDRNFGQYLLEKIQFVGFSRYVQMKDKYWSYVNTLRVPEMEKESVQLIFRVNLAAQMSDYNMSRDVQELITGKVLKSCLIALDDLTNIIGINDASSLLLSLLRNLLSLPKKQCHLSVDQYTEFFKTNFHSKLNEKSHNEKLLFQMTSIEQNILKVIFNSQLRQTFNVNLDGQYKTYTQDQLQSLIRKVHPDMVMFGKLVQTVAYLINQIKCIDRNVVLLGRRGTGKRFLAQLCAELTGLTFAANFSEAILAAIKYKQILFLQMLDGNSSTLYEQLLSCEINKDLQKLIQKSKREIYYTTIAGEDLSENKLVLRCKEHITFLFVCDERDTYQNFSSRQREVLNMPVCLVEEWPAEAILNLYTINDPNPNMHAKLFTTINLTLSKQKMPTIPLKIFQKYLKVFIELQHKMSESIEAKVQLHQDIHYKFNESFELVSAWEKRVDILREEIEESIIKSGQNIVANEVSNMILTIFLDQIKEQEEISAKEESELKILKYQIEKRLELIKQVMMKIQRIVSSFQRTELGELKKIYKANLLVYFGVECLCILLGEDNHEEKTINRLLADPNLLMRMKAPQLLQKRNEHLEAKLKKQLEHHQQELRQSENELAKTVIEWIKSIIEYWAVCQKQKKEEKQYEEAKIILQESSKKHQELLAQVNGIKKIIVQKMDVVETELDFKASKEIQLKSLTTKLENAVKIIPILKNQEIEAKTALQELRRVESNLRGNCLLAAVTATFLPMRPIAIKQELLELTKKVLRQNSTSFSQSFMADLSSKKANSLEDLNLFLIENITLPKLIFDPHRKFLLFLQDNRKDELREGVIENSEERTEFQDGKIYHVSGQFKANQDKVLLIDWSAIAVEEKQAIFLKLAEFKRPEYFQAKKELQIKINRNLSNVVKLKEVLYRQICEKKMKIIEDDSFASEGQELTKMERETQELKLQAEQKMKQIQILTKELNEVATKVIHLYETIKYYKSLDLALLLDVCCKEGDAVSLLLRWALTNIKKSNWFSFLLAVLVGFNNQTKLGILKDLINGASLKVNQSSKLKKPALVSSKHWDIAQKISSYGGNFDNFLEGISRNQKQFESWCIDQSSLHLPPNIIEEKIDFIQQLCLLFHFKPETYGFLSYQLINENLPYELEPVSCKEIVQSANSKFPIIARHSMEELKRLSHQLNEGRYHLARVSKIGHQADLKRVVWKSMQAKEWLICYDYHSKQDLHMLESICYYVMNYDKQPGFRVIIALDHTFGNQLTFQEKLVKSSAFLSGISVELYPQDPSYDTLMNESNNIQYQISFSNNASFTFGHKNIFNRMYRLITLCYTAIITKYPRVRSMPFKRILDALQYIKNKNLAVQFNIFTIVNYLSRVMSVQVSDPEERRQIEELWEYIVDERKISEKTILGVPLQEQKIDKFIKNNFKLIGCQQSHEIRMRNTQFEAALTQLSDFYDSGNRVEEELAFVRSQMGRLPVLITGKESKNPFYKYFYEKELEEHNSRLFKLRDMLEDLNRSNVQENYLQTLDKSQKMKLGKFIKDLSLLSNQEIPENQFRQKFMILITKIKAEHDFLLYFNPNLPTIIVDPYLLNNFQLLVSSFFIDRFCIKEKNPIHKLDHYLQFTKLRHEKDVTGEGLYLTNLKCKEFQYHNESKSIGYSYEINGIEPCPILLIVFKPAKESEGEEVEDLQLTIGLDRKGPFYSSSVQYSTVFVQWGLRGPRLLAGLQS